MGPFKEEDLAEKKMADKMRNTSAQLTICVPLGKCGNWTLQIHLSLNRETDSLFRDHVSWGPQPTSTGRYVSQASCFFRGETPLGYGLPLELPLLRGNCNQPTDKGRKLSVEKNIAQQEAMQRPPISKHLASRKLKLSQATGRVCVNI